MDLNELIEKRKGKLEELEAIMKTGKIEKRKLSTVEDRVFNEMKSEIEEIDKQVEEKRNIINKNIKINRNKMGNKFNLLRAIEARSNGRSIEDFAEILEAGRNEMKKSGVAYSGDIVLPTEYRSDVLAGTQYAGQEIVTEDKFALLGPLRDKMTLVSAGANFITNLIGDVSIPIYAGTNATWKTEVAQAADGAGAFSEVTLSPKRLTTYIDVSKQFLNQDSVSAEQMLMNDIVTAVATKLEVTLLGTASGNTEYPAGIFYGKVDVPSGTTNYHTLVGMEKALAEGYVSNNYTFVMSPSAKAKLKTTQGGTGLPFILSGNDLIGYPYYSTNAVASNRIALGDFTDLIIGQWGGYDLIVDPYTVAQYGKVRIVVNAYFDGKFRRTASYQVATML